MSGAQWINWHNMMSSHSSLFSHRGQTAPLLTYDGTAAQEPGDHHQPSCQDQDVGGHGECTRGQQAQVLSFIDQCPDPNTHHHPATHLEEKNTSQDIRMLALIHILQV